MNIAMDTKPYRPCTEYNIFFQLERAYILQVLLHSDPALDVSEVFHPSQPNYAGMPPLPERYASLTLTYDWHLPGKEKRRKRKHRKSHGAISFKDLSDRISAAWKMVDPQIKSFCAQVCKIGLQKYKVEMKEWKKLQEQKRRETVVISTKLNALNTIEKPTEDIVRQRTISFEELPKVESMVAVSPSPVASEKVSNPTNWEGLDQQIASPVLSSNDSLEDFQVEDILGIFDKPQEQAAPSNNANVVDIEDADIMNMYWQTNVDEQPPKVLSQTDYGLVCQSCSPAPVVAPSSSFPTSFNCTSEIQETTTNKVDFQYQHNLFGSNKCYNQTLEELQRMKFELEQQAFEMQKATSMQCHSLMARSA